MSKRAKAVSSASSLLLVPATTVAKPQGVPGGQLPNGGGSTAATSGWQSSVRASQISRSGMGGCAGSLLKPAAGATLAHGPQHSTESAAPGPAQGSVAAIRAGSATGSGAAWASCSLQALITAFGAAFGSVAQRSSRAAQSASDWAASDWAVSAAVAISGEANKNRMVKSLKVFMLLLPRGAAVTRLALLYFLPVHPGQV
jgi:hypothetical protein